ncbi:MAG: hypothetical protein B6D62_03690 [Candidatus Cloacimonas sp. 4484_275]|nr:MAG: hypothetical protein B6D62_03690 [Candidatus Cloacimonas sp. 4484_275]
MRKFLFFLLAGLLIFSILKATEQPVVRFYLFYSDDCDICHDLMKYTIPDLEKKYNLEYQLFEISDEENMNLLIKLEDNYGQTAGIPEIFIGKYLIGGEEAAVKLEDLVRKYSETGCEFPRLSSSQKSEVKKIQTEKKNQIDQKTQAATAKTEKSKNPVSQKKTENQQAVLSKEKDDNPVQKKKVPVYVAYFFKIGCKHCDRTFYDLKALKQKYPQLVVREFNIADKEGMRLNEALCELYGVPEVKHQASPMVFIGDKYFSGEEARLKNMEPIILENLSSETEAPWTKAAPLLENSEKTITERFESFGIFTIIVAGLIDGINPCAFATIIFLISYLTLLGRKGKQVLIIGAVYTFAVFITYFSVGILGLSILEYLQKLKFLTLLIKFIFLITGILVLIFAFYSLYDFYLFKKGKTSEMVLQLPTKIKQKIHKSIREKSKIRNYVLAAFLIGFLVSLQELFCTGQVYLPTLVYMSRLSGFRNLAYFYLVIYNLLFIVPLIIVFLLVYWGMSSQTLAKWMQKRLGTMKILMAIIFLLLGIILIVSALFK